MEACHLIYRLAAAEAPEILKGRESFAQFLPWAREIAAGDLLSAHEVVGPRPFVLNPLYAYVLAPLAGAFERVEVPVVVAQAVLGAATTALASPGIASALAWMSLALAALVLCSWGVLQFT